MDDRFRQEVTFTCLQDRLFYSMSPHFIASGVLVCGYAFKYVLTQTPWPSIIAHCALQCSELPRNVWLLNDREVQLTTVTTTWVTENSLSKQERAQAVHNYKATPTIIFSSSLEKYYLNTLTAQVGTSWKSITNLWRVPLCSVNFTMNSNTMHKNAETNFQRAP